MKDFNLKSTLCSVQNLPRKFRQILHKRKDSVNGSTRPPRKRFSWVRPFLIGLGTTGAVLLLAFSLIIWRLIATAPDIASIDVSPSGSATWICDADGNELRRLSLSDSNRDLVSIAEIPVSLQNAIIAIEDSRFYEHNGIDLRGIARAFWRGITRGSFSEGASTITQQLIKNNVFTDWTQENSFADRFARKVQEQYLAVQLEKQLTKEEILEDYLNTINFGAGCYGVEAAAQRYFGKDVSALTLSESAVLAAIPQNPTGCNPIEYPKTNQTRQHLVLQYMEEQGYITHEEYTEAVEDDVYLRIRTYNEAYTANADHIYSYYEDALIEQVIELLQSELNYTYEQASQALYSGGLRIYSAEDAKLQEICDEEFQNASNYPEGTQYGIDYSLSVRETDGAVTGYGSEALRAWVRENHDSSFDLLCDTQEEAQAYADAFREYVLSLPSPDSSTEESDNGSERTVISERLTLTPQPQASLILIEQSTGLVRAIVGGRGEKTASLTLNRATDTTRQPGSTFKILTAYAPALDVDGQTLATLYENEPYEYEDGTSVSNWDINDYSGTVTIREAITRSINVVAVRCITEITPRLGFTYAQRFGISTLVDGLNRNDSDSSSGGVTDVIQPLALGGITNGVTNLELCAAYAAIANSGIYNRPLFFTKVLDRDGNVLLSATLQDSIRSDDSVAASGSSLSGTTRILQESTAFLLTSAMEDVVSSEDGTAYGTISAAGQPIAGKTGTTSAYKDIWFVGYTPYYTCSVWGGYDNNQSLPDDSTGHTYSRVLWSAVMERVHAGLPIKTFTQPDTIKKVTLCSESHLLAQENICPDVYSEYFAKGTEPTEACTNHVAETESEAILIYQDLLDELLPESEAEHDTAPEDGASSNDKTEILPDSEAETLPEAEDNPQTDDNGETPPDTGDKISPGGESEALPDSETTSPSGTEAESGSVEETSSLDDLLSRLTGQGLSLP